MAHPEYRISSGRNKTSFWAAVVLAILSLPTIGIGLGLQEELGLICLTPTGIGMLLLAAYSYFAEWRREEGQRIQVTDDGLIYIAANGEEQKFLWEHVETLTWVEKRSTVGGQIETNRYWVLKRGDGETLVFDKPWDDMDTLIGGIQRELIEEKLPQLRSMLLADEVVRFGQYGISTQGLHNGDMLLRWDQIEALTLEEHRGAQRIMVTHNGESRWWASTTNFPNYFLFLRLLPVIGKTIGAAPQPLQIGS